MRKPCKACEARRAALKLAAKKIILKIKPMVKK